MCAAVDAGIRSPATRPLAGSDVDVWLTNPDAISDPALLRAYEALLSKDEYLRYRRFLLPKRCHEFLVSRALLRSSLSRCAAPAPTDWCFDANEFGRPFVSAPESALRFSLSHADGLIVCAVTAGREIGIDVEHIERRANHVAVAQTTFAPPEMVRLKRLSRAQQAQYFFSTWTLKEAYAKARGRGMALPFREFWFDRDRSDAICLHIDPALDADAGLWDFRQYRTGSGYLLSLAVERAAGGGPEVKWRDVVPLIPDREGHV